MSSLNQVQLIGRLGKEPESKNTQRGELIVNLNLATSETWKDKETGERKERTEWHRVVIFNPHLARFAVDYLHKGSQVFVEGSLQTRKWVDDSGSDRYSTEVVLQKFQGKLINLSGRGEQERGDEKPAKQLNLARDLDDEVPL